DRAAVEFNQSTGDRRTEAGTLLCMLTSAKLAKRPQLGNLLPRHAAAVIADLENKAAVLARDAGLDGLAARRELACVVQQLGEDLAKVFSRHRCSVQLLREFASEAEVGVPFMCRGDAV